MSIKELKHMKLAGRIKDNRSAILKIVESNHTLYPRILHNHLNGYNLDDTHLELVVDRTSEFMPDDIGKIQNQLEDLLGVPVDVFTPNLLPDDHRERILAEAEII